MKTIKLEDLLYQKFGYQTFRKGQKEAIEAAVNDKDTLVMLPTGSGKSICYQLPAYLKEGLVIVISPLLSLMQDQVEGLKKLGERRVAALNSLSSSGEKRRILKQLPSLKFLFVSPEMVQYNFIIQRLLTVPIAFLVVDEAHCISQWGLDFRPDYLKIGKVKEQLKHPVTMALTATATKAVREEIKTSLQMNPANTEELIHSVNRNEIKLVVKRCEGNKDAKLKEYVEKLNGSGIIYFSSKKKADSAAVDLRQQTGRTVESYHSDLEADDKIKIQQQFLDGTLQVICATSAFGMGVDKPNVRYVIHYHVPANPEMYLQEIGRCSRDRKEGVAVLLFEQGDQFIQKRLQEDALPDESLLSYLYKHPEKVKAFQQDPKVQIGQFYYASNVPLGSAIRQMELRKQLKEEQLSFMLQYIHHTGCKRAFLLRYFEEDTFEQKENCCSSCTDHLLEQFIKKDSAIKPSSPLVLNWKERLHDLYKMNEQSTNSRKI